MLLMQPPASSLEKASSSQKGESKVKKAINNNNNADNFQFKALNSYQPIDSQPHPSFAKKVIAMLLRHKWFIILTTLTICLIGVVTYLIMKPISITIGTVLLAGVLSGLCLGCVIAFIHEWQNSLLLSREELQDNTGYPVIGVIPEVKRGEQYLAKEILVNPYSRIVEAYRLTATVLIHGQHYQPQNRKKRQSKSILVTSINAGEGKSVSASNLALSFADLGEKVLLVDADLRMPSVQFKLGIQNKTGLINYLMGNEELSAITQHVPNIPNMYVITAGSALNFSPLNLLSQNRMTSFLNSAKKYFDYVIIDSPPVRGFADTLLLHTMADSTIIVVSEKKAQLNEIKQHLTLLQQVKDSIIGLLKIRAKKDIVDREYFQNYSRDPLQNKVRFKKNRKLNLGKNRYPQ